MHKFTLSVVFGLLSVPLLVGCGGGTETSEVEVTAYDPSVEARLEERAQEQVSEAERRKSAQ